MEGEKQREVATVSGCVISSLLNVSNYTKEKEFIRARQKVPDAAGGGKVRQRKVSEC